MRYLLDENGSTFYKEPKIGVSIKLSYTHNSHVARATRRHMRTTSLFFQQTAKFDKEKNLAGAKTPISKIKQTYVLFYKSLQNSANAPNASLLECLTANAAYFRNFNCKYIIKKLKNAYQ